MNVLHYGTSFTFHSTLKCVALREKDTILNVECYILKIYNKNMKTKANVSKMMPKLTSE